MTEKRFHAKFLGLMAVFAFATWTGCGDSSTDGVIEVDARGRAASIEGLVVQLSRRSEACAQQVFDRLLAEVGLDVEFPAEAVAKMAPPCPGHPNPAVDVYFVGNSLILDFAASRERGSFPRVPFDAFEVRLHRSCGDPVFSAANVDQSASSIAMPVHRVQTTVDRIEVNLAGMDFSAATFLKIDLEMVDIHCAGS
jgi:hypothetical protein